ncbi:TraI domain-containing protein [Yersinia enterocolitica]|uniref:TraI domain-containing protein n=1 Tax=Yersinia enterocolitica TaxID=630 RepID=UPI003AB1D1D8
MLTWVVDKINRAREEVSLPAVIHNTDADGWFSPQSTEELLAKENRKRALRQLWESSPFSRSVWEIFWLTPLRELAIRVQQLPAAQSGPYARKGGMLDEALDVAVCAVRLSRGWMLPPGVTPEEQAEQSSAWCTAIFWAALLHNLSALNEMTAFHQDGSRWYSGLTAPSTCWRVRFTAATSETVFKAAMVAYRLLPEQGLCWLSRWSEVTEKLLAYLSGNKTASGIIHAVVSEARLKCGLQSFAFTVVSALHIPVSGSPTNNNLPAKPQSEKAVNTEIPEESFWHWLVSSVDDGRLTVNAQDSLVHIIKQHVFVRTPDCFYRYLATKLNAKMHKDDIQKNFEALNRHHSRNGKGIYIYRKYESEKKDGRFIKIFGYMIPLTLIFTHGTIPNDSKWLSANK